MESYPPEENKQIGRNEQEDASRPEERESAGAGEDRASQTLARIDTGVTSEQVEIMHPRPK